MVTFGAAYPAAVALGVVVSVGLLGLALRNVEHAESKALAVLTGGIAIWLSGNLLSVLAVSRQWSIRWVQLQWVGVAIVPTALFVFVLVYTGRRRYLTRRRLAALAVVPTAVTGLVATSSGHELLWTAIEPSTATPGGFVFENGVAFYAYAAYSYALLAIATVALARFILRSTDLYRGQATLLMIAALAPWAGNVGYVIGDSVLDATPIGFTIAAAALGVAVLRYRLTDIVPIARNTIVEHINDGVIVLDRRGRVVDVNPRAAPYLRGTSADSPIGERAGAVLPDPIVDWLDTAPLAGGERAGTDGSDPGEETVATSVRLDDDGDVQHLAVETTALADGDRRIGQLVIVRDVTAQRRYERELERQNERLDRFASVVSHDLRNPLNVADGYLSILEETYDAPEIEEIGRSLERMDRIIEDVLALTGEGEVLSDRERVDLASVAESAWDGVDTADATLRVETGDHAVATDPSRLTQAFENLFRNAVEHGGPDVTVTVGTIRQAAVRGFFVADDGPGIPEEEREAVLESGYTTAADGTGLGLDIVARIVDAHGWSFAVSESADGGARFDVRYDGGSGAGNDRSATVERDGRSGGDPTVDAGETDRPDAMTDPSDDSDERCQCGP